MVLNPTNIPASLPDFPVCYEVSAFYGFSQNEFLINEKCETCMNNNPMRSRFSLHVKGKWIVFLLIKYISSETSSVYISLIGSRKRNQLSWYCLSFWSLKCVYFTCSCARLSMQIALTSKGFSASRLCALILSFTAWEISTDYKAEKETEQRWQRQKWCKKKHTGKTAWLIISKFISSNFSQVLMTALYQQLSK